jgi:O-antigen/teichoic acid export membrane protein
VPHEGPEPGAVSDPDRPFRNVVAQAAKLTVGRGLSAGLAIPRMALVAQLFGVAAFGRYSVLQAYGMLGVVLIEFGMKTVGPRRAAQEPGTATSLVGQIAGLQVLAALGVTALAQLTGLLGLAEAAFLLSFFLAPSITSAAVVRRGLGDAGLEARLETALSIARIAPLLLALVVPLGLDAVYVGTLLATLAVVPVAGFSRLHRPVRRGWGSLLREGAPLVAAAAASQLFARVDLVILGWFHPDEEVAVYSAASLTLLVLALGAAALAQAAVPWFTALRARTSTAQMLGTAARRSWGIVGLTAAAAAATAVVAGPGLDLFVGIRPPAGVLIPVVASAAPAAGAYWLFMALASAERSRVFVWAVGAALAVNVALDLLVIPAFASAGAASATLASEMLLYLCVLLAIARVRRRDDGEVRP